MPTLRNPSGKRIRKSNWELHGYQWAVDAEEAKQRAAHAKMNGQEELNGELQTAIRYRDLLQASALLSAGADPNYKDLLNSRALGYAIESGSVESVELLLSSGADPNLRTGLTTPLSLAVYEEQWRMADRILKAGADPNLIGSIRMPSLHIAVSNSSNIPLVESLIFHGAELDTKDVRGLTPLDWARRKRKKKMVELLERAIRSQRRKSNGPKKILRTRKLKD